MRFRPPAFPHIHFMAAAPLDAWVRLLLTPGARIPVRYWPRAGVNLVLSACVTVLTLPERVVLGPVLWWWGRRSAWRLGRRHASQSAPAIVVLGYYRSGTTHLHNLLACDRASHTPRWGQVLTPQGWAFSWFVLRLFSAAVLPTKRPQDDMAFGPEWPGEDDFAVSGLALASPLAGRVVLPACWEHFRRFGDLRGLSERERCRWRRAQWSILARVRLLELARRIVLWRDPSRRLVLKTPPHTGRALEIRDVLGGAGRVKFIHLSRDPGAVLASNERLMRAMRPFHLQDGPDGAETRRRLIDDYNATERRYTEDEASLGPGDAVRMRYEDLIADPVGELRRAYGALGVPWTDQYEARLGQYLESIAAYRSETQKIAEARGAKAATDGTPGKPETPEELKWLVGAFGHDRSAVPPMPTPSRAARRGGSNERRVMLGLATPAAAAAIWLGTLGLWAGAAWLTGHRWGVLGFAGGVALGEGVARLGSGSVARGLFCAGAALALAIVGMTLSTRLADFGGSAPEWGTLIAAAARRFTHESTLLWTGLGVLAAYRLASRRFGGVPGR